VHACTQELRILIYIHRYIYILTTATFFFFTQRVTIFVMHVIARAF
jgi:hypothetical protein